MDKGGGQAHQICSFMCADNYWIMSHSKTHLEQMLRGLIEDAERWVLEPKPASLWWTSTGASEEMKDITICTRTKILGYSFNQAGKTQDCLEERMQQTNKAWWVEGCEDLQKQGCAVEGAVWENGGACPQCILLWKRKLVLKSSHLGQS